MKKNTTASMMKGVGIGMALGGMIGAVETAVIGHSSAGKSVKKNMSKAISAVGDMIGNITDMIK